jgi:dipeptidyl aminopeptidase/acylaminoacyl peptidase
MAVDERLRSHFERAGRPADPTGVLERIIARRARRARRRRAGVILVAVGVLGVSVLAVAVLDRSVRRPGPTTAIAPAEPTPHANGSLAFTTGERIVISDPDGSNARTVPSPAPGLAWHVAWSPDGTRLAVAIFGDGDRSLWVMDSDGSHPVQIARADNIHRPSWHPDGEHLTYSAERDGVTAIHVVRADGTDDRTVYSHDAPGTYAVFSSTFSPDGSQILFDAGTEGGYDLFLMDADGSKLRRLTSTGTDYNPSWSPDGAQIVFTRQEAASESDIFVMASDGTHVHRLTDGPADVTNLDAEYSPDGAFITYTSAPTGGTGPIMVMDADGTDARTLVHGQVLGFSWQPVPLAASPTSSPHVQRGETPQDIGLGSPVCDPSTIAATFASGPRGTATVATQTTGGDCPKLGHGTQVLAVDVDGDGRQDASFGPLECDPWCTVFAGARRGR